MAYAGGSVLPILTIPLVFLLVILALAAYRKSKRNSAIYMTVAFLTLDLTFAESLDLTWILFFGLLTLFTGMYCLLSGKSKTTYPVVLALGAVLFVAGLATVINITPGMISTLEGSNFGSNSLYYIIICGLASLQIGSAVVGAYIIHKGYRGYRTSVSSPNAAKTKTTEKGPAKK